MSYLAAEITRTDSSGTESIIKDWERVTIRKGLDQKANTVTITLTNPMTRTPLGETKAFHKWVGADGELIWQENDAISVKARYNNEQTALSDSDILTLADALEFTGKLEANRTSLIIKGVDKTFALLNQQVASAYTLANGLTSGEMIKAIIELASYNTDGSGTFEVDATLQTEATYELQKNAAVKGIQTRRINNSLFPIVPMAKVYKPIYEWIDDLSTIESTNNFDGRDTSLPTDNSENPVQKRKMKYFVDKDNIFRWFYPDNDVDYTITIGSVTSGEDDVKGYSLTKSTFDVLNFIIYNGGLDLYGAGTLNYYFDENTKSKKLLSKYKSYVTESVVVIQDEINAGNLVANTSGVFTFQGNRYNANTYGFTTTWGVDTTGFDDDAYNIAVRTQIDVRCKRLAQDLTVKRGSPRWKGNVDIKGRNFVAGELIELTSYVHGIQAQPLRILDLTHNITKGGWTTSLSLEEDEAELGTNLS